MARPKKNPNYNPREIMDALLKTASALYKDICEVCGKIFWPNSSGHSLCSEECQRIRHNQICMDYYNRRQTEKQSETQEEATA